MNYSAITKEDLQRQSSARAGILRSRLGGNHDWIS
jgi:hypothetical protein